MSSISLLSWQTLSALVNEIRSPNQFLRRLLYSTTNTNHTETIDIGVVSRGREIAPFVRRDAEAVMVPGHSESMQQVTAPNIRIKKPFTPSPLLFGRRVDTSIYPTQDEQLSAIERHIARDMQGMENMIVNAEEWLVSMALQAVLAYSVADQEVFTITYPRPGACNITLTTFWNDATPANVKLFKDTIHAVKRVFSDQAVGQPTDCILGTEAADALLNLVEGGNIKMLDTRSVVAGVVDFTQQFNDDGVIYLGTIGGIRFWEYGRTATLNGTTKYMIRAKYAEFISVNNATAHRVMEYGAISDIKALRERTYVARRFAKSWEVEDPSSMIALEASRPLPVPRRPAATVSVKVVSG